MPMLPMPMVTELDTLAAMDEVAPRTPPAANDPALPERAEDAPGCHDSAREDPSVAAGHEVDSWARRAAAANGFGDAAMSERPSSYELYLAARAHRAFTLGEIAVALIEAVSEAASRAYARYRRYRRAQATYASLQQLDDRELRDLGFDRSEIESIAAEASGRVESTRRCASGTSLGPS